MQDLPSSSLGWSVVAITTGGNVRRWRRDVCCVECRSPWCRAVCSPDIGVQLPELCSSDQPDNSFRAYAVFIEAMSPRSEWRCLPLGKESLEYEPYRQQTDTQIA
jgi:hypothetical protein